MLDETGDIEKSQLAALCSTPRQPACATSTPEPGKPMDPTKDMRIGGPSTR